MIMPMEQVSVIAIGLPNAGKSTFIAALGYVLQHDEVKTALKLAQLSDEVTYINSLTDDWLGCKEFERTKTGLKDVTFELELRDSSALLGKVVFPDISGETFEHHWSLREWEADFAALASRAEGILLFVHPLYLPKPYSVADRAKVAGAAGEEPVETKPESWDPEKAAPQVKLVDFLQMVASHTERKLPIRLTVIVSAWDLVLNVSEKAQPDTWLEKAAPLLHQYIVSNPETFDARFFGVSAQGGDNSKDGARLRAVDEPSRRVKVIGADSDEHDLSAPLKWALGSDA